MNDDYDQHIVQKYRLGVALAIIKNTPETTTPKTYLEVLRSKIIPEMESYDPDMTVCEDDFNDDDDDFHHENYKSTDLNINNDNQKVDSQMNDSITILKDFDFNDVIQNVNNDSDMVGNNSVSDVLRILKGVGDEDIFEKEVLYDNEDTQFNQTQSTYYEGSQTLAIMQESNVHLTDSISKIQEKFSLDTTREFQTKYNNEINDTSNRKASLNPEKAMINESQKMNTYQQITDNLTHVSQSQDNIVIPKYFIERNRSKDKKSEVTDNLVEKTNEDVAITFEDNISKINTKNKQTYGTKDNIIINEVISSNDSKKHKLTTQGVNIEDMQVKRYKIILDKRYKSNTKTFNEVKNKANVKTDISNSEIFSVNNLNTKTNEHIRNLFQCDNNFSEEIEIDFNTFKNDSQNKLLILDNFGSQTSHESNNKASKLADYSLSFSQFSQEFDSEPLNNSVLIAIDKDKLPVENLQREEQRQEAESEKKDEIEEQIIEELFDELTDSQTEVVPFKVLEEFNKVKSFLNKCSRRNSSECVSDSGYKSDSQSRNSLQRASQSSIIWLNQSAHCLLQYLSTCPLVVNTEEIINEIARTLGRLIDRLHEEEKYPSFLEEHLKTVDSLLKYVYEEESADTLLKKDENIYRLFLLNKSSHIIKYTTEKILTILEDLLTLLTTDELLEISRTVSTENLSYIFHILEILLKKLLVYKSLSQQSTQNSQEEDIVLKRSSIADIWRKKWNPEKKCVSSGGVKECVLIRCGDVLNKLIVQAMDGYSLISYLALQCFNLLQN